MDRRTFLASGAALGREALAAGHWRMRLSTSTVLFNSLPVEEACARIAAAGFEGVDFWQGQSFRVKHLDEAAQRLGVGGLKEVSAKYRLRLCAFTCYLGIPYQKYFELLGKTGRGAGLLIRESRYLKRAPGQRGSAPGPITDLAKQMRGVLDSLKPDLEAAEKHGFHLAIENHSGALLNSVDSFKAFLEMGDNPRLGIALAPYHLQRANIGSADFTPWLRALARADYRGWVNPFMHENLGTADGDRRGMPPGEMAQALVKSRSYLEHCRAKI